MKGKYTNFKPIIELRTKYLSYLGTSLGALWIVINGFSWFIVYVDKEVSFLDTNKYVLLPTTIAVMAIMGILTPFIILYYNSIHFEIVEDEVHVNRGIITKTRKIVPYRTITNIEIKRGPFDRLLKMGTIELQTAGSSSSKIGPEERLDGLPKDELDKIQLMLVEQIRTFRGSPGTSHDADLTTPESTTLVTMLKEIKEIKSILQDISKN